jgi:hypothetical protein
LSILPLQQLLDKEVVAKQTTRVWELLERLFQVDFLKGLAVTFRAQNPKNIVTVFHVRRRHLDRHRLEQGPTPARYTR